MTVEDQRSGLVGHGVATDRFPVGMRVLAVDDDPICLKVLENLLRKCQYHGVFVVSLSFVDCFPLVRICFKFHGDYKFA